MSHIRKTATGLQIGGDGALVGPATEIEIPVGQPMETKQMPRGMRPTPLPVSDTAPDLGNGRPVYLRRKHGTDNRG